MENEIIRSDLRCPRCGNARDIEEERDMDGTIECLHCHYRARKRIGFNPFWVTGDAYIEECRRWNS